MTDQLSVTREIAAPAEQVWALVSDVTRMGEWSPENDGGKWLKGATEARPGAKFRGVNRRGKRTWSTLATVIDAEPGRSFSFRVTAQGLKVADWAYSFEPTASGCRVTESWTDRARAHRRHRRKVAHRCRRPRRAQPRGHGTDPRAAGGDSRVESRGALTGGSSRSTKQFRR